ncbi:MAG: TnpV protein [Lachnospiraceae bacterium]|nr:TnpV protein [Lachnospiraceae bacterium]
MELTYYRSGDYLYPNLTITDETPEESIGKYGMLRETYLKENKRGMYSSLLLKGKLNSYLADIEKTAQERLEVLMEGLQKAYPGPEKSDQMAWVAHQNSLKEMAEETIYQELIYI